jgi:hypothetical protein
MRAQRAAAKGMAYRLTPKITLPGEPRDRTRSPGASVELYALAFGPPALECVAAARSASCERGSPRRVFAVCPALDAEGCAVTRSA